MNLGKLIQLLGDLTDDSNHNTYPTDQKIRLINLAIGELWAEVFKIDRRFYVKLGNLSIEIDKYLYDFPANTTRMISYIKDEDGNQLRAGNHEQFNINTKGLPLRYDVVGNQIFINPTPTSTAIFPYAYYYFPPDLENGTDEAFFPKGFEQLIVLKAVLLGNLKTDESMGDPGSAFNEALRSFKTTYEPIPDAPRGINPMMETGVENMMPWDKQIFGEF